jgi:uncharacterized protein (TIGR02300 family)
VVKAAWGLKRTCQSCAAHFYDMHKSPIACPKCGAIYDPDAVAKTRRSRTATGADKLAAQRTPVRRPEPEAEIAAVADPELEVAEADDEEEEDVIEDTSELGSDEDVATVIEKDEEDKET